MPTEKKIKIAGKEYGEEEIPYLIEKKIAQISLFLFKKSFLPILTFVFFYFSFLNIITHGTMDPFHNEALGMVYMNMWDRLATWKFDIEPGLLQNDVFILHGKEYTAWGIFPAFLRGIFGIFLRRDGNDWSRISVICAAFLTLSACVSAFYRSTFRVLSESYTRIYLTVIFALTIAFGSPLVILLSCAYIFHEAIVWGLAWTSLFSWALISFLFGEGISPKYLFILSLSSGLALLSQAAFGVSTAVVLFFVLIVVILSSIENNFSKKILNLIDWKKLPLKGMYAVKSLTAGILPFLLCLIIAFVINIGRWGNPFEFYPYNIQKRVAEDSNRLNQLKESGIFNLLRIPHALFYYFIPSTKYDFSNRFPYIEINGFSDLTKQIPQVFHDIVEEGNSLIVNSPFLMLCAFLGLFSMIPFYGRFGAFLVFLLGLPFIWCMAFSVLTLRYSALFMPFLVLCAIPSYGFLSYLAKKNIIAKIITVTFITLIAIMGIYTGIFTAFKLKMYLGVIGSDDKNKINAFFNNTDRSISNFFAGIKVQKLETPPKGYIGTVRYDGSKIFPLDVIPGQLWSPDGDETIFWHDGKNWLPIRDDKKQFLGPINIRLLFTPVPGTSQTIFQTGKVGEGDSVYVKYLSDDEAQIGFDHWGVGGYSSDSFKINPQHVYLLELSFGSFYTNTNIGSASSNVIIKLDGRYLLNKPFSFYPANQFIFGKNEINCGPCGDKFTGQFEEIKQFGRTIADK